MVACFIDTLPLPDNIRSSVTGAGEEKKANAQNNEESSVHHGLLICATPGGNATCLSKSKAKRGTNPRNCNFMDSFLLVVQIFQLG